MKIEAKQRLLANDDKQVELLCDNYRDRCKPEMMDRLAKVWKTDPAKAAAICDVVIEDAQTLQKLFTTAKKKLFNS